MKRLAIKGYLEVIELLYNINPKLYSEQVIYNALFSGHGKIVVFLYNKGEKFQNKTLVETLSIPGNNRYIR